MSEPSVPSEGSTPAYGPVCDTPVERAAMVHRWNELTFLHWPFGADVVQRLIPPRLTVETFDRAA